MTPFQIAANRYKILVLVDLDCFRDVLTYKKLLKKYEKEENYELCEGIKQAIEIKLKENSYICKSY